MIAVISAGNPASMRRRSFFPADGFVEDAVVSVYCGQDTLKVSREAYRDLL
jgi:predicted PhzF superfamily epimerase YddE/YHI9